MRERANVLRVERVAGFGSLSALNECFRNIAGASPTDFERETRVRPHQPLI